MARGHSRPHTLGRRRRKGCAARQRLGVSLGHSHPGGTVPVLSLRFVILLVGMLAAPTTLTIVETGSIAGHVRDPQGKPIKSAMVDVVGTSLSTITNDSGYYVFPKVPVGAYTVRARLIGHSLAQPITVRVTANATAVADLTLAPSAATLEAVVISGYAPGRAANGVVRIR